MSTNDKFKKLMQMLIQTQELTSGNLSPQTEVLLYQINKELGGAVELPPTVESLTGTQFSVGGVIMNVTMVDHPIEQEGNAYAARKVVLHLST